MTFENLMRVLSRAVSSARDVAHQTLPSHDDGLLAGQPMATVPTAGA